MSAARLALGCLLAVAPLGALGGCKGVGDSQKHLRTAVEARQPTLDQCYATTLAKDATAAGKMELTLTVAEQGGRVEAVKVARSELADTELQGCVRDALVGVQISPAPKANLEVAYVLEFGPRG